jgi:hypothetical protein
MAFGQTVRGTSMKRFAWIGLWLLVATGSMAAQGKLEAVRTTVYTTRPDAAEPRDKRNSDDPFRFFEDEEDSSNLFDDIFGGGLLLTAPFWVPVALWETLPHGPAFSSHPYGDGVGYLHAPPGTGESKYAGLTLGVENGNDFSGINRFAIRGRADTSTRWGLSTQWAATTGSASAT